MARQCGAVWLLVLLTAVPAAAQISPGPLSRAHAMLSGATHCIDCHDFGKNPPEFKCLDCHRDIRERLAKNEGLHPSLVGSDRTGRSCVKCHSDHNGADFPMIRWETPVNSFDHRKAGYLLEGRHASLACRGCHQASRISEVERANILIKNLNSTYLGLSTKCMGCHTDEHHGQLSSQCADCHDPVSWKNARFDHRKARFALTGAHERLACEKCHNTIQGTPIPYVKYVGLQFSNCTPCHSDPHRGSFPWDCRKCHNDTSWKTSTATVTSVFDHSKTRYPLEGRHAGVTCDSCHRKGNFAEPVAFARCSDCHRKDPHRGQFASRDRRGNWGAHLNLLTGLRVFSDRFSRHPSPRLPHAAAQALGCLPTHKSLWSLVGDGDGLCKDVRKNYLAFCTDIMRPRALHPCPPTARDGMPVYFCARPARVRV